MQFDIKTAARAWMKRRLADRGLSVRRLPQPLAEHPERELRTRLEYLVAHRMMKRGTDFFFIQIGAFDGQQGDPIHDFVKRHNPKGILVEPQARYFEELQRTYSGGTGLNLKSVAIGPRRETRTLYTVSRDWQDTVEWAPQLASFDKQHILKFGYPETAVAAEDVECITMDDLLDEVPNGEVDLLQIDVEGYDYELLKLVDFRRVKPAIVRFEHKHLSAADFDSAVRILLDQGYEVAVEPGDTTGYLVKRRGAATA